MFTFASIRPVDPQGNVLVSDELIKGQRITKFPGGGLDGEGVEGLFDT
ncbi:MAG: hypothetical protein IPI91_05625 [Flavobacteriales bacterium]|nr:hypothetical protein [Flavobacteriales bacterium]